MSFQCSKMAVLVDDESLPEELPDTFLHERLPQSFEHPLLSRLQGLCGPPRYFAHHELIFGSFTSSKQVLILIREPSTAGAAPLSATFEREIPKQELLGRPESYSQHVTTVRPVHFIPIEGDVMRFVGALGYTLKSEVVKKGMAFVFTNSVKVLLSRVYAVTEHLDTSRYELMNEDYWLVELESALVENDVVKNAEQAVIQLYCDLELQPSDQENPLR